MLRYIAKCKQGGSKNMRTKFPLNKIIKNGKCSLPELKSNDVKMLSEPPCIQRRENSQHTVNANKW